MLLIKDKINYELLTKKAKEKFFKSPVEWIQEKILLTTRGQPPIIKCPCKLAILGYSTQ